LAISHFLPNHHQPKNNSRIKPHQESMTKPEARLGLAGFSLPVLIDLPQAKPGEK